MKEGARWRVAAVINPKPGGSEVESGYGFFPVSETSGWLPVPRGSRVLDTLPDTRRARVSHPPVFRSLPRGLGSALEPPRPRQVPRRTTAPPAPLEGARLPRNIVIGSSVIGVIDAHHGHGRGRASSQDRAGRVPGVHEGHRRNRHVVGASLRRSANPPRSRSAGRRIAHDAGSRAFFFHPVVSFPGVSFPPRPGSSPSSGAAHPTLVDHPTDALALEKSLSSDEKKERHELATKLGRS